MWRLTPRPGSSGLGQAGIWTAIGGAACDVLLCRCWERLPPSATFTDGREGSIKSHKEFDCESTTPNFLHLIHNLNLSLYSRSVIYSRRDQTHCFLILKGVAPRRADLVSVCCRVRCSARQKQPWRPIEHQVTRCPRSRVQSNPRLQLPTRRQQIQTLPFLRSRETTSCTALTTTGSPSEWISLDVVHLPLRS